MSTGWRCLPVGVEELTSAGHQVLFEAGAGQGSGIVDADYAAAGARIVENASEIWATADMIVKVKEPQARSGRCCDRARSSSPTSTSPPTRR